MKKITKKYSSLDFEQACQLGDLEAVKTMYAQSSDKLPFASKSINIIHCDHDRALLSADLYGHPHIVKFLMADQDFTKNIRDKVVPAMVFNRAILTGDFELIKIIGLFFKEQPISQIKELLAGFNSVCKIENIEFLNYFAENIDIYSKLPASKSEKSYSLMEHGFITACESGNLNVIKFLLTSPKLKEKINLDQIVTPIEISNKDVLNYFIFDLNIPRNCSFASCIVTDKLDSLLEKRDTFNSLNTDLQNNNNAKSKIKI